VVDHQLVEMSKKRHGNRVAAADRAQIVWGKARKAPPQKGGKKKKKKKKSKKGPFFLHLGAKACRISFKKPQFDLQSVLDNAAEKC